MELEVGSQILFFLRMFQGDHSHICGKTLALSTTLIKEKVESKVIC